MNRWREGVAVTPVYLLFPSFFLFLLLIFISLKTNLPVPPFFEASEMKS